jgi:hypothetical protein
MLSPRSSASVFSLCSAASESAKEVLFFAIWNCGKYVVTLRRNPYHKVMPRVFRGKRLTLEERFWMKVSRAPNGCWLWQGATVYGYGQLFNAGKPIRAHRYSYELAKGPIPAGLFVCHTCDTPGCVNPEHLFVGTPLENVQDMITKGRKVTGPSSGRRKGTHCKNGHALTEDNLRPNQKSRQCRQCHIQRNKSYRQ